MKKKNVIWIMGDQHRAQALSVNGDPNVSTPNIDNMAVYGVNFTGAVGGFPLCCPFRGSMLTGLYPHKCVPGHEYRLPPEQKTIAHTFRENGYHTAYIGKWHLDGFKESAGRAAHHTVPPDRRGGFDYWLGYENNNSQWDCYVHGDFGAGETRRRLNGYETDALTDILIGYIKERGEDGAPFFAVLSVQPPHNPYSAPARFMGRHNPARLVLRPNVPPYAHVQDKARRDLAGAYAMIENIDWNIGRVRAALNDNGLDMDTHIIYFSDHGDMHGSHGQFLKTTPYQEALCVPFIISGGQPDYEGWLRGRADPVINHVDIAPTTLGLCGIRKPAHMEGTDYSHYRLAASPPDPDEPASAYIQSVIPTLHQDSVNKPWRGVVTRDGWKYVCFEGVTWLMFNLKDDPYELVNMAYNERFRDKRAELNALLKSWVEKTGDAFALPV